MNQILADLDEKNFKKKQLELCLTDNQCNKVIENLKEFFSFSDAEADFAEYIMQFLEEREK